LEYNPKDDLYFRLGVPDDSPSAVIKKAFRVRIREVHPDLHGPKGTAATQRLTEAADVLLDSTKRTAYDGSRKRHFSGVAASAGRKQAPRTSASRPPQSKAAPRASSGWPRATPGAAQAASRRRPRKAKGAPTMRFTQEELEAIASGIVAFLEWLTNRNQDQRASTR
jgi:DnaJ-class molecular chaperone